jgi:hypothetical protein
LPHPDAEAIERAIEELQDTIIDWDQYGPDLMPRRTMAIASAVSQGDRLVAR